MPPKNNSARSGPSTEPTHPEARSATGPPPEHLIDDRRLALVAIEHEPGAKFGVVRKGEAVCPLIPAENLAAVPGQQSEEDVGADPVGDRPSRSVRKQDEGSSMGVGRLADDVRRGDAAGLLEHEWKVGADGNVLGLGPGDLAPGATEATIAVFVLPSVIMESRTTPGGGAAPQAARRAASWRRSSSIPPARRRSAARPDPLSSRKGALAHKRRVVGESRRLILADRVPIDVRHSGQ